MSDLALVVTDNGIDLNLTKENSLERDGGLETAVLISLFTDQRVAQSEVPAGLESRRGWWGDEFLETPGDKIGSKIWTFSRGKITTQTAASVQVRAQQALQWMVDDGVAQSVDVVATAETDRVCIEIAIKRPGETEEDKWAMFWDGQSLKR